MSSTEDGFLLNFAALSPWLTNFVFNSEGGFDEVMVVDDGALTGSSSDYNTIKDNIQYKSGNR